ncbi:MAG: 30S ribosomal protein S17 [Planctomycetes bacterium]|jgi:small subunit ribosomal protein S17|nr:30S ribosomal protein S17 [Planctomycetota bacterium]
MNKDIDQKENGQKSKTIRKKFSGIVVSSGMDKTVVARVDRVKIHPKYRKRYTVSRRYKVHDEKNIFKTDDKIEFVECRPLSKEKRWRAIYS